jgi:4-hydroxy-2-oxoheptanedioate aldolase
MRENRLKQLWLEKRTALNAWLTLPSSWSAEVMANTEFKNRGFDALTIDMQHGLMDYQTALTMLQAISSTNVVPMVRVLWNDPGTIMRILDAGAYGIICPMVNTRVEAEAFVSACRYPPQGERSYGPIRAQLYGGTDYFAGANQTVLALAMIETEQAVENIEEIINVPGLDGLYVGSVDLSISLGLTENVNLDHPKLSKAINKIARTAAAKGLLLGAHVTTPEQAAYFHAQSFQLLTPVNDTVLLRSAARQTLEHYLSYQNPVI